MSFRNPSSKILTPSLTRFPSGSVTRHRHFPAGVDTAGNMPEM
jgi:hypothetical protein